MNAAKFGGGSPVNVYAEAGGRRARRCSSATAARASIRGVPDDRRGMRESIVGRMERHGGRARRSRARREPAPRSSWCWTDRDGPRVLIVDDHQLFRAGVRSELEDLVEIVGDAATVDEAVAPDRGASSRTWSCSTCTCRTAAAWRSSGAAEAPGHACFLALSVSDAAEDVIAVIRAGARGYVTKTISGPELADAIAPRQRRRRGLLAQARRLRARRLRRRAAARARRPRARPAHAERARGAPAPRARLHVQGDRPRLDISTKTVEAHVSSVLRKLQLSSRHELSRWAAERGLDP